MERKGFPVAKRGVRRLNHPEDDQQRIVIQWAAMQFIPDLKVRVKGIWYPARVLDYLYAIPNGGKRNAIEAKRLQGLGVKAGVLDLHLALPWKGLPGLWIEMKVGKNDLTEEQDDWAYRMDAAGYVVRVCWSAEEAINSIRQYLEGYARA